MKKINFSFVILLFFYAVAIVLWKALDNIFYLFNFVYIGTSVFIGLYLMQKKNKMARHIAQFLVGSYMFFYLGVLCNENMQMEGFWYYLFLGVFEAAVIHYVVAKIVGPVLFGRGWCGYACWTAMVLDFLPFHVPKQKENKKLTYLRFIPLIGSFIFVVVLFWIHPSNMERIMWWSFLIGNAIYYALGISLAYYFKDNRAFCKYICPISLIQKIPSSFALVHIKQDEEKCVHCKKCDKVCPMGINISETKGSKEQRSSCILCGECVNACPKKALHM